MTEREKLIEEFKEELGDFVEELAKTCSENPSYKKLAETGMFDDDEPLYKLNEDGDLVQLSEEETERIKKKYKRSEIENQVSFSSIKERIQPFEIIQVFFPHTDESNTYSIRPALVLPPTKQQDMYSFMMLTKGAKTDPIYRKYEVALEDWKEEGLTVQTYARTNIIFPASEIIFIKNFKHYGFTSDSDIKAIRKMFMSFRFNWFKDPVAFMFWLIRNKISDTTSPDGNNNYNPIQTVREVSLSKKANCVDIAVIVYNMCKSDDNDIGLSKVYLTSWYINETSSKGHIYTLFMYKNKIYVFNYDQINISGSFISHNDTWAGTALFFSNMMKKNHPDEDVKILPDEKQVITPVPELDVDDAYKYKTQKDWLNAIMPKKRLAEWVNYNTKLSGITESFSSNVLVPDDKIPQDISCFTDERCKNAELWVKRTGFPLIIANRSWDEVKKTYHAYKTKGYTKQVYLNDVSLRIYGKTIDQIYKILRSRFMNDGKISEEDTIKSLTEDSDLIDYNDRTNVLKYLLNECMKPQGPVIEYKLKKIIKENYGSKSFNASSLPFRNLEFAPYEIEEHKGLFNDKVIDYEGFDYDKWLTAYNEAYNGFDNEAFMGMELKRLHLYQYLTLQKDSPIKKESLLRIGINPEVDCDYKQRQWVIEQNLNKDYKIETTDLEPFISILNKPIESLNENMDQFINAKPVFVVFKRTPTSLTNTIISKATRSYWAHTAFSFDYTLKECYTFDFFHNGFVKESIYSYPKDTIIKVMCCFVPNTSYDRIKSEISHFKSIKSKTSYSLSNLIGCLRRKANENTVSMVCSNFVDYMLKIGDTSPSKMSWSIMTPGRLSRSIARSRKKHFYQVYLGNINSYNSNNVLLYLSKCSISNIQEDAQLEKEINQLYKEIIEPFINLEVIEE